MSKPKLWLLGVIESIKRDRATKIAWDRAMRRIDLRLLEKRTPAQEAELLELDKDTEHLKPYPTITNRKQHEFNKWIYVHEMD